MRTPQFLLDEFVDNNIFNTAMTQLLQSIRETGSNDTFLIPGVINPTSLSFSFNNNLVVSAVAINSGVGAFKCLFQTGALCAGHGTTDGADSPNYSINFTGLVPGSGSVTAYIVAQYAQVQEDVITIIGPPAGHPDYSPSFVPYNGYTRLQDSLNIIATTTAPDNQISIELARVTLSAGQTIIPAVDTTHQVLATVNAQFVNMTGDVTGRSSNNTVNAWQGKALALSSPTVNNVPLWNGTAWVPVTFPTSLPPSGPASGDLSGTYPAPVVAQSSAAVFAALQAATVATTLGVTGKISGGADISAIGHLIGANASAINHAVILGQLIGSLLPNGYLQIPVINTAQGVVVATFILQWGFVSLVGQNPNILNNEPILLVNGNTATANFPIAFPNGCLSFNSNWSSNDSTSGTGPMTDNAIVLETLSLNNSNFTVYADANRVGGGGIRMAGYPTATAKGLTGFIWFAVGF